MSEKKVHTCTPWHAFPATLERLLRPSLSLLCSPIIKPRAGAFLSSLCQLRTFGCFYPCFKSTQSQTGKTHQLPGHICCDRVTFPGLQKFMAGIPSAALEAGIPGIKEFSLTSRILCPFVKFLEYSLAGITCGLLGQGVANSLMLLRCV